MIETGNRNAGDVVIVESTVKKKKKRERAKNNNDQLFTFLHQHTIYRNKLLQLL